MKVSRISAVDHASARSTIRATLTLNGAAIPSGGGSPGTLRFVDPHTGLGVSDTVASTGPATATFSLFAGRYDVYFDVAAGSTVLPSQTVLLERGVSRYEMDGYRLATVGPIHVSVSVPQVVIE